MVKDFFREIIRSKNRFLSILVIVALGVAFFSGIRAASPDMKLSADTYYDEASLMDIQAISTLGLTDGDVEALRQIRGVKAVNPAYSADVLCSLPDAQPVVTLMSVTEDMNLLTVEEGRLPQKDDEIFLDEEFLKNENFQVGDSITLLAGEGDLADTLKHDTYTIVGAGSSPFYISLERGTSTVGDGSVSGFAYLLPESFTSGAYSSIYLTVDQAREKICYSDAYENLIEEIKDRIGEIEDVRCQTRYDQLMTDGQKEIADGQKELDDAKARLEDARDQILDGEQQLADGKEELEERSRQLADGKEELKEQERKLQEALAQVEASEASLASGRSQLEGKNSEAASGRSQLEAARQELEVRQSELEEQQAALSAAREELEAGAAQITAGEQQLAEQEEQWNNGSRQLADGRAQLQQQEEKLDGQTETAETLRQQLPALTGQLDELTASLSGLQQQTADLEAARQEQQTTLDAMLALPYEQQNPDEIQRLQEALAGTDSQLEELHTQTDSLEGQKEALQETITQYQSVVSQYDEGVAALEAARQQLADREAQLNEGKEQLAKARSQLEASRAEYEAGMQQIAGAQAQLDAARQQLSGGAAQLSEKEAELTAGQRQLEAAGQQLAAGEEQLAQARRQVTDGERQIDAYRQELSDGEQQIAEAWDTIAQKEQELEDAREEFEKEEADARQEIADGEAELTDARKELSDLEVPSWYILGRDSIQTYVEYEQNADRVEAIGNVFPVIFFLVAALICLTTMTRMVEENRTQIGTLKALGYGKARIGAKYICYAFLASFIGSIIGLVAGQKFLPVVIIQAYKILYNNLPEILAPLYAGYSLTATLLAVAVITLAAFSACSREMREVPAQLMRPEAPKNGKRILLERVTPLWKHMTFSQKSTARNLFRYKKRFLMTVLGIGGCMGLLLVGFGLKDSIMAIGEKQFGEIRVYSATLTLDGESDAEEKEKVLETVQSDEDVTASMEAVETTVDVSAGGKTRSSYLVVASEPDRLEDFVKLRDRTTQESYRLDDSGVIITEKLATLLDVKAGDTVTLSEGEEEPVSVKITHVVENYFYHYVYMTPDVYRQLYGKDPEYTEIFTVNRADDEDFEQQFQSRYMELPGVLNVTFISSMAERVADMLRSMDTIIYVVIIAAGLLAFVVLYNLNNINISERRRELATLKVLGFYDIEVSQYVFRENVILTVIGAAAGVLIGLVLHRFVILTAEVDMMMFGRNIKPVSFLYSILLTFLFSMLVNVFMHFQLKKLNMVESMKSVE